MSACVIDTHAFIWYVLDSPLLSAPARRVMGEATRAGDPIYVASISVVEVTYLVERGRLPNNLLLRVMDALEASNSALVLAPLDLAVARALMRVPREHIPDMPDRIIAATAAALQVKLITRDHRIQASNVPTVW